MFTQVTENDFIQAFIDMNREDNFSRDGLIALYNFFEQYEDDTGEPMELDVIAICCEFSESSPYDVWDNFSLSDNGEDYTDFNNGGKQYVETYQFLNDNTFVIVLDNGDFLYQDF